MEFNESLQKKIAEALKKKQVAKREDLLYNYAMEATLGPDYVLYFNPRVTAEIDGTTDAEVGYLKFTPMVEDGLIVVETAVKGEMGAEEFTRGDSRRTGTVNVRAALNGFGLKWPRGRKLKLPVGKMTVPVDDEERQVMVLVVKRPPTKKRNTMTSKQQAPKPESQG